MLCSYHNKVKQKQTKKVESGYQILGRGENEELLFNWYQVLV